MGGSSTTVNNSSYTPTQYELELQQMQADYAKDVAPNAKMLNSLASNLLQGSLGAVQVDYDGLNNTAQNQISAANASNQNLSNGVLSNQYLQNMTDAVKSSVDSTLGANINELANRGVLNSSVTNKAINDLGNNVSDAVAQNYLNSISAVNGINNSNISNATSGITTAAAAQEAAQTPSLNLWNASLGLNGAGNSALAAAAGKGTTTTNSTSSGGGLLSGLLGGL